jgi:hypothetical protein
MQNHRALSCRVRLLRAIGVIEKTDCFYPLRSIPLEGGTLSFRRLPRISEAVYANILAILGMVMAQTARDTRAWGARCAGECKVSADFQGFGSRRKRCLYWSLPTHILYIRVLDVGVER